MLTLGVDTALQRCSVAIMRDGDVLAIEIEDREKGHAERIAPMAAAAFEKSGVAPMDLDRIGVVVGPGGFTGVRVGLSFCRAMGLATGAGVVAVTSLEALAQNIADGEADGEAGGEAGGENAVAAVIDARRGQVYAGLYRAGAAIAPPFVAAPEDAGARLAAAAGGRPVVCVGTGCGILPERFGFGAACADPQIDPVIVASIAAGAPAPRAPPAPLYLRAPDAKPAARPPVIKPPARTA